MDVGARGNSLKPLGDLDGTAIDRLRALSVITNEELLGFIYADPEAAAEFIGVEDLSVLQADLAEASVPTLMAAQERVANREFPLGLELSDDDASETVALLETFLSYAESPISSDVGAEDRVDHRGCLRPIRDQGDRGTCVAHAIDAVLECHRSRLSGRAVDYSPQFLYWLCKQHDGLPQEGTFLDVASQLVVSDGVCEEMDWPYDPTEIVGNISHDPPPAGAAAAALGHCAARFTQLARRSSSALGLALDNGDLVAFGIPVYANFMRNPAAKSTGIIPMPGPRTRREGGHAMCAVGYELDPNMTGGGYFIVKNSWGTSFADQSPIEPGYACLPFQYIDSYGGLAFTYVL